MLRRSKRRKLEGEKQAMEKKIISIADGKQEKFFPDKIRREMKTMWEIPQISHFLHLTRESLNIPQLSIYEMERMLFIPRASKQLANIMTCLLSSPITKAKLRKVPPMPYEFWTNILAHKITSWFKVYRAKHKDVTKVLETIGVEPEFWNIFPDVSLLNGKDFEDLSFKQRVWLLKTVCDTIMHTRKTVQEDIANQPWEDQFETVLGFDRYGAKYIYFPQFISNDLRIYRQRLDNKILSTVKPVKSNQVVSSRTSGLRLIGARFNRHRAKKSQSCNASSRQSNVRENRIEDKDLNSYGCNNDSATSSFISEDTNLSSTSTCSNNNNNFDTANRKHYRSSSKTSDESTLSSAKSSGYDTNTSSNKFLDDSHESLQKKMFKGFSNPQDDNCNIGIINDMLVDLVKSEIDEKKKSDECKSDAKNNDGSVKLAAQENSVANSCKSIADLCVETLAAERIESEKSFDNLSSSSKTDDEKLNEIISAESSKLPENVCSKSISTSISNIDDNISTSTSKSDDEKLSETKSSDSNISAIDERDNTLTFNGSFYASSSNSGSLSERVIERKGFHRDKVSSSTMRARLNDTTQSQAAYEAMRHNEDEMKKVIKKKVELEGDEMDDDKAFSTNETRLQEAMEDDLDDYTNNSGIDYDLQRSKQPQSDEYKQHFDSILSDLGVSDFHLVVDSVEGLRSLIATFSASDSEIPNSDNVKVISTCEAKLMKKLTELLSFLETTETALKEATRKAKSKLQREWSNFNAGSVEDQDSSGEGGLSSNWWVLGSQGCPLSAPGDATLRMLPQPALSPLGSKNQQTRAESGERESWENDERRNSTEKPESETQEGKQGEREKQQQQECKQRKEEKEATSNDEDAEQQTRRVLRARGVSSYTEQFYSDDESEEDELEVWTDVEAVYAAPGTSADTSTTYADTKARHAGDWSETDSDQDWILPSSRKRKNKRPSAANRKLKSLQHKLQNIRENASQSNEASSVPHPPAGLKIGKDNRDKSKDNSESRQSGTRTAIDSASTAGDSTANAKRAMPTICKIEAVSSVHSELDIKDEGPIYASSANHYVQNSYDQNQQQQQQSYMMTKADSNLQPVNYYVMPQNPAVAANIMPQAVQPQPIQQGYYVQAAPDYMIQSSQPHFLPALAQQQQPIFQQQQDQQMMAQQSFVNNAAYVPYVVATTQSQAGYNMIAHRPPMANHPPQKPQDPLHYAPPRSQIRFGQQSRYATPRQIAPHPNGTAVRGNAPPVRGNCPPRPINPKSARSGNNPQQRPALTAPRAAPKRRQTIQESGSQRTTSVIVLSDSDDEIEMIVTQNVATKGTPTSIATDRTKQASRERATNQTRQQPVITSDVVVPPTRDIIPPQILERMNQGGISITPVKSTAPPPVNSPINANTQLVVVVNDTGSHYALALPNGSKLILTPEQVAQIRASNGGKLIL